MLQTKATGIRMAKKAIKSYQDQADDFREERDKLKRQQRQIEEELAATIENLTVGLIPNNKPEVVQAASDETGALHLPQILQALAREHTSVEERRSVIAGSPDFQNRDNLIHPTTGAYTVERHEARKLNDGIEFQKSTYEFDQFTWLYERGFHLDRQPGGFQKFWRVMTLANLREQKALEVALARLEVADFAHAVAAYEDLCDKCQSTRDELNLAQARYQQVVDLVDKHDSLLHWLQNYDSVSVASLRGDLVTHLEGADYQAIHHSVRKPARILLAKCHALEKKLVYNRDMLQFLDGQIMDRMNRVKSIQRVARKWSVNPYQIMYGNKEKWLVELPAMKHQGTAKRVHWIRTMGRNVNGYDNYHHYNCFMTDTLAFLAYDAFAFAVEERMPYEGFTRTVINGLADFRLSHNQERADYGMFKTTIREHRSEVDLWEDWDGTYHEEMVELPDAEEAFSEFSVELEEFPEDGVDHLLDEAVDAEAELEEVAEETFADVS